VAFIFANNDSLPAFLGSVKPDLGSGRRRRPTACCGLRAYGGDARAHLGDFEAHEAGWGETFGRGAERQDPSTYPTREKIGEVAREINARLFAKLAEAGDDVLAREPKGPRPPSATTVGDQLAFLALHDSYHVGQLAYVRKALGLPGVVG
jgi:hypothetical protein